jgi:hypothetical protein
MHSTKLPTHLVEFSLSELDRTTRDPAESADERARRVAAIRAMYEGYAPRDASEDMLVSHIITLRFLVAAAMKNLVMLRGEPAEKARKSTGTLSRALLSWIRQFEQRRTREARQRAEVASPAPRPETQATGGAPPGPAPAPVPAEAPRASLAAPAAPSKPAGAADLSWPQQTGTLTLRPPPNGGGGAAAVVTAAKGAADASLAPPQRIEKAMPAR